MSKALRIKIINYLRENDAVAKYVDIRAHVLKDKDSVDERNELKATLDYLSNKRLIAINGSYEFLHWTASYGLYNIDNKLIATKLTKTGQSYNPDNESDDMEATVPPVLAVIKKTGDTKSQPTEQDILVATAPVLGVKDEPGQLPWYIEPEKEEVPELAPAAVVEPEQLLPWYVAPADEEAELLPEPVNTIADIQPLPWYVTPAEDEGELLPETAKPAEAEPLPWYVAPVEEAEVLPEPAKPTEPETQPRYVAPVKEEADTFEAEMLTEHPQGRTEEPVAQKLPWYKEPDAQESKKPLHDTLKELEEYVPLKPWYVEPVKDDAPVVSPEPIAEITAPEPKLPLYVEPTREEVPVSIPEPMAKIIEPEPQLPWNTEIKPEAADVVQVPAEEKKEPVIYRFPPIEPKLDVSIKAPAPMVIEVLNENLSNSIDAISNIRIKKPAMLTGDFEKDTNVILKFILVVVLFLLFGCIVWLYMG